MEVPGASGSLPHASQAHLWKAAGHLTPPCPGPAAHGDSDQVGTGDRRSSSSSAAPGSCVDVQAQPGP